MPIWKAENIAGIFAPDAERRLRRAGTWRSRVRGLPETVILRGQVIVEGREFVGQIGGGRFLRRRPFEGVKG